MPIGRLSCALLALPLLAAAARAALAAPPARPEPAEDAGAAAPEDSERYTLRAEAGLEYDSNAHRAELVSGAVNPPIVGSPVERLVLAGTLSDLIADGQAVALAATLAGKLYDADGAHDEDVAIVSSSAAWQEALGAGKTLTLSGAYYEAFQNAPATLADADERRDFRSIAPGLQLDWPAADRLNVAVSVGYRMFIFKPDRDDDFGAPAAGLELRWARQPAGGGDWEANAGAAFERRAFGGPALIGNCPTPAPAGLPCSGPDTRIDDFLMSHLEVTRTGRVLIGGGYAFHYNLSNSFGETVMRHFALARFAAALPGGLVLAARAELLFAFYRDPVVVGQISAGNTFVNFESIGDENRSSARIDLSRALGDRTRLIARYTFYANELGTTAPISYRRQTLLLSLAFTAEK
jgi:hypothetical protein